MYKDKVIGMIEIIQERVKKSLQGKPFTKENRELPTIGTKYEPGQTGFKLKKGYLLCDVVEVEKRDFAIKVGNNDTSISDFYGVHPLVGIIYAVGLSNPVNLMLLPLSKVHICFVLLRVIKRFKSSTLSNSSISSSVISPFSN